MAFFSRPTSPFDKGVMQANKVDKGEAIVPYQKTVKKATESVRGKENDPCLEAFLIKLHNFSEKGWGGMQQSAAWENGMPLDAGKHEVVAGHFVNFTKKGISFDENGVKTELTWEEISNLDKAGKNIPALLTPKTTNNADAARARAALAGHIDGLAYALKLPKNVVSLYFPDGKLSTIAERIEHVMTTLGRQSKEIYAATVQDNDLKKAAKEAASDIVDRIGTHISKKHEDDLTGAALSGIIATAIDSTYMETVVDRFITKKKGIPQAKKDEAKNYILTHTAAVATGDAKTLEDQILTIFANVVPNPLSPKRRAEFTGAHDDAAREALIADLMNVGDVISAEELDKKIKEEFTTDDTISGHHFKNLTDGGYITVDAVARTVTRVK